MCGFADVCTGGISEQPDNYIVVMTHRRPECLVLCLEALRQCRGIEKYPLCVAMNEDSDPVVPQVVERLWTGLRYQFDVRPAGWLINRANSEAFKSGAMLSKDFFIVLCEDEIVSKDFLEVMEYVAGNLRNERLFGVSVRGIRLPRDYKDCDVEVLCKAGKFWGQGFMLFKEPFDRYARSYFCEEFYQTERMGLGGTLDYDVGFLNRCFPMVFSPVLGADGLLDRVLKEYGLYMLVSVVPRCHEIGFNSVHSRNLYPDVVKALSECSFATKVALYKDLVENKVLRDYCGRGSDFYWDIESDHKWGEFRVRSEGMY